MLEVIPFLHCEHFAVMVQRNFPIVSPYQFNIGPHVHERFVYRSFLHYFQQFYESFVLSLLSLCCYHLGSDLLPFLSKLLLFFPKFSHIEIILSLEISQMFSLLPFLLLFPLEPCLHMVVLLGNQRVVDQGNHVLFLTWLCPINLICSTHSLEHQLDLWYNIFKHFLRGDASAGIEMVLSFQIISNNDNRVNFHSIAPHPYLSLRFQVLKSLLGPMFHPGHVLCPVRSQVVVEVVVDPGLGLWMVLVEYRSQHVPHCQGV